MSRDGGVEVSRSAIKAAHKDLADVLEVLVPGITKRDVTPEAFPAGSAVEQLLQQPEKLGGDWTAAIEIGMSLGNARSGVGGAFADIAATLEGAVVRLDQALRNLEAAETAGTQSARRVDV
jgi:hypothetical protein